MRTHEITFTLVGVGTMFSFGSIGILPNRNRYNQKYFSFFYCRMLRWTMNQFFGVAWLVNLDGHW